VNAAKLTTGSHVIDANRSKITSTDALIKLENGAQVEVLDGHMANLIASRINVGDFLVLGSNTLMKINNGTLLNLTSGSIVKINDALVKFTGSNATLQVTNNLVPTNYFNGVPVYVAPGANPNKVSIAASALAGLNANGNIIKINGANLVTGATTGFSGSLISIQSSGGTVKIGP
jgi:hypothetical protein